MLQLEDKDNRSSKQTNEKIYISRALQDLQEQFAELRTDFLKKTTELQVKTLFSSVINSSNILCGSENFSTSYLLQKASQDRAALQQRLDELSEQNRLRQDRLSSCQVELEDERAKVTQLEKDLQKSKQEVWSFCCTISLPRSNLSNLYHSVDSSQAECITESLPETQTVGEGEVPLTVVGVMVCHVILN